MQHIARLSSIASGITWTILRWRGGFRSHSGFTLLGLLVIVIMIFLVVQLMRDKPSNEGGGNKTGQN